MQRCFARHSARHTDAGACGGRIRNAVIPCKVGLNLRGRCVLKQASGGALQLVALTQYECLENVQACCFAKLATPSPADHSSCQHLHHPAGAEHQICISIPPLAALLPQNPVRAFCHVQHGLLPCLTHERNAFLLKLSSLLCVSPPDSLQ